MNYKLMNMYMYNLELSTIIYEKIIMIKILLNFIYLLSTD